MSLFPMTVTRCLEISCPLSSLAVTHTITQWSHNRSSAAFGGWLLSSSKTQVESRPQQILMLLACSCLRYSHWCRYHLNNSTLPGTAFHWKTTFFFLQE